MTKSTLMRSIGSLAGGACLLAAGVFLGATMSSTRAQPAPAVVWESMCIEPSGVNNLGNVNDAIRTYGAQGWEPYAFFGQALDMPCFKRRR